jgi:hypothetical protein
MTKKIIIYFNVQATSQAFDGLSTPAMVSIGCVSQAGEVRTQDALVTGTSQAVTVSEEFYAELSDTFAREECSVYVQQRVLPLLEGMSGKNDKCLMTEAQTALELKSWVERLGLGHQVMFHSSHARTDWHFVEVLFDKYG